MEEIISKGLWQSTVDIFNMDILKKTDTDKDKNRFLLCVPGLIFLKFVSHDYYKSIEELRKGVIDHFELKQRRQKLPTIPATARWEYILERADDRNIGTYLDEAMHAIEKMNSSFKNILPKEYSSPNINVTALSNFIKKLGQVPDHHKKTNDILRYAYDCIVRKLLLFSSSVDLREINFAPGSVIKLMVSMIGAFRGKIFDPCCGIGSFFIESIRYIKKERISLEGIKFYGQESRRTLFQLCCMHLALYGIHIKHMKWDSEITINSDRQRDLKADFILCAPPCKSSGILWIDYATSHLSREGYAALLISQDSVFIKKGNEPLIHNELLKTKRVDCIVTLPEMMSPIPEKLYCILILAMDRGMKEGRYRYRGDEILLIDAAAIPSLTGQKNRELSILDIYKIVYVYLEWREKQGKTMDKKGFFKIIKTDDNVKSFMKKMKKEEPTEHTEYTEKR